jgi:cytochrome c biogenesis protein CcmG/thiol:disulfide interchange protein DsbE
MQNNEINKAKPKRSWALFIPLLAFFVLCGVFASVLMSKDYSPDSLPSALIGKHLPDFALSDLLTEKSLSKKDLLGEPVLVNVWATWCPSCRVEHEFLNHLASEGVKIIGVNYKDDPSDAIEWLKDLGNPYKYVIKDQDGSLGFDLGVVGAPETYFINAQGVICYKHIGILNTQNWEGHLKSIYNSLTLEACVK